MKKFLSILLALAVGFTFTFGSAMSAFAADEHEVTPSELNAGYAAAQNALTAKDAAIYTAYIGSQSTYADVEGLYKQDASGNYILTDALSDADPSTGTYYVKTSYAVDLSVWKDALKKAYDDTMDQVIAKSYKTEATLTDYVVLEVRDDLLGLTYGGDSKYAGYAAATQFDNEISKIVTKMEACDTSIYSTTTYKEADITSAPLNSFTWTVDGTTYYVAQDAAKAQVAVNVKAFKKTYLESYKAVVNGNLDAAVTLNAVMTKYKEALGVLNDDAEYVLTTTPSFLTTAKESSLDASHNANVAKGITVLESDIAAYLNDEKTEKYSSFTSKTTIKKADVDEAIAAYRTGMTWLNNNVAVYTTADINYTTMAPFVTAVANVTKWTAKATELKAKKNDDGSAMYDAETVDNALFDAIAAEYGASHNGVFNPQPITYLTAVEKADYKAVVEIDDTTNEDINTAKISGTIDNAANLSETSFYDLEWTSVKTAIDTYTAAVDAATTKAEVKKAQAALKAAIAKVKTKEQVDNLYKDGGSLNSTFDKERTALVNYYKYFVTLNTAVTYVPVFSDVTTEVAGDEVVTAINKGDLAYWYILNNARTIDEVKALATEAKAAVGAAKTTTELKAEAQKVIDMIAALPATVTLENKADIKAAVDAYSKLDDTYKPYVSNVDTLKKAVKAIQVAEYTAVDTAVKALPLVSKASVADKKAVNDAYDAAKVYNETEMYLTSANMTTTKLYETRGVVALIQAVQALELEAIKDLTDNLPAAGKVTADSKAAIEAARTAYDNYVSDYVTNYDSAKHTAYNIEKLKGYEEKIVAAELELAEVAKFTDADAKAYVQDLAIAVRTVKSGKKVKVTVNADVQTLLDNGFTVEYKFYKSTKKGSGYKNTVNKTTNTYTNTNPVKGKNYYKVKLVVKNADGTVVATTPLTQCKYGVRTMK